MMSLIRVNHLTFSHPGQLTPIFNDINLDLDTDWRLGFVGRNGRGKTTFFKILMGEYESRGSITASVEFDYFPYEVVHPDWLTFDVLAEIAPVAEEWQLRRELSLLGVNDDVLWRPFETLSQGEQTKVLLATLFLNEGRFLLIDEPTNHLDVHGRQLVAAYLRRKKGFILVSHDRIFLDGCVDHIMALNKTTIDVHQGDFSTWWENFERRQAFEEAQNERLQKEVKSLTQAARRTGAWSDKVEAGKHGTWIYDRGYVGHKAEKMMKRSKAIEKRRERAVEEASSLLKDVEKSEILKLTPLQHWSEVLVRVENVAVCHGDDVCLPPISLTLSRGERVVLDGANGSGKSSLLRAIVGDHTDYIGTIRLASGLVISVVPQDTSHLKGSLRDYIEAQHIDATLCMTMLRKLDFDRALFDQPMETYSAGQKKKVLLAKSLSESAHLYIWDEPLNYIDLYSRLQLEEMIQTYQPTMLLVEHDQAFRENIATRTVNL